MDSAAGAGGCTDHIEEVWSGWKLIQVPEGAGGAEARHRQHLLNRRRHQMAVLELLQETYPGLAAVNRMSACRRISPSSGRSPTNR